MTPSQMTAEAPTMGEFTLEDYYRSIRPNESSSAIATLKTLERYLQEDKSLTISEFGKSFKEAIEKLKYVDTKLEVESIGQIYFRFITLVCDQIEIDDFRKEAMAQSKIFFNKVINSRASLANHAKKFIKDGCKILVHSYSGAVLESLKAARRMNKHFEVYVTESAPDYLGKKMVECLKEEGIEATLILDSAVGYIMERVKIVLVGADGVVQSGGIINKIGTYTIALCAKAFNKPFHVLAESYKFVECYPLSQTEIPQRLKWKADNRDEHPLVDYTPPSCITLLHTDLGTLTTAAVLDTLLQLYT